jgi:hypothetical protein
MLFKISLVLLSAWLPGVLGLYSIGSLHHALLLGGLMLMLLSFARGRDAALRRARETSENAGEAPLAKSAEAGKRNQTPARLAKR